jgi:hypothetical protein
MSAETPTQQTREAGPIWIASGPRDGTHWTALAFTAAVAVAIAVAASTFPRWGAPILAEGETTAAKPAATAAPTPVPTPPAASALASEWVGQSGPPGIVVNGTTTITVRFRNAGTGEWRRGSPSEVRLGTVGPYDPAMAASWPYPERPAIQTEAVVPPGEIATFNFDVRGVRPGVFRLRLRPVVDGVAWLNDQGVYVDVEVR